MVASINDRIKARKDVLAPKIKELRAARARMSDLTDAHEEARAAHRKVQDSHDARLAELEEQVASLQSAVEEVRCGLRVGVPPHVGYGRAVHTAPGFMAALWGLERRRSR